MVERQAQDCLEEIHHRTAEASQDPLETTTAHLEEVADLLEEEDQDLQEEDRGLQEEADLDHFVTAERHHYQDRRTYHSEGISQS